MSAVMITYDLRAKSPAVIWREMPTVMQMDSSEAGRTQLLYTYLHTMGMDENENCMRKW
jgi:hypothetical protein